MKIANVNISSKVVLAPMAGVTDQPFRQIAKSFGAGLVYTELVSSDGLVRENDYSRRFLRFSKTERPIGTQLFGSDPDIMANAAQIAESEKPDFIDLNFGCPVRKVVKRGAGAALMKNLSQLQKTVKAVVSAVKTPVSCKIRSGWDINSINCVEAARIIQGEGGSLIAIHPRTQTMGFSGKADWSNIRDVKNTVTIPVIGNGDIVTPQDARNMMDETGCDLVMVGRGAMGRPWLIKQINDFLEKGILIEDPGYQERIELCLRHYHLAFQLLSPNHALKEMRKHIGWTLKGIPGSARVKDEIYHLTEKEAVQNRLKEYAQELQSKNLSH